MFLLVSFMFCGYISFVFKVGIQFSSKETPFLRPIVGFIVFNVEISKNKKGETQFSF